MEPENDGFQKESPFPGVDFQVHLNHVNPQGCKGFSLLFCWWFQSLWPASEKKLRMSAFHHPNKSWLDCPGVLACRRERISWLIHIIVQYIYIIRIRLKIPIAIKQLQVYIIVQYHNSKGQLVSSSFIYKRVTPWPKSFKFLRRPPFLQGKNMKKTQRNLRLP